MDRAERIMLEYKESDRMRIEHRRKGYAYCGVAGASFVTGMTAGVEIVARGNIGAGICAGVLGIVGFNIARDHAVEQSELQAIHNLNMSEVVGRINALGDQTGMS